MMHLDVAVYLDIVKNRSLLVSLQTSGRVLRKDKEGQKTQGLIIDSFVNQDGIQIEVLTADRILNYYKQILKLCDEIEVEQQLETYDKMLDLCKNMTFDETNKVINVRIDDDEKHNVKIKLDLKTSVYDFNKIKIKLVDMVDKLCDVSKEDKFNIIVKKLKEGEYMGIETEDFEHAYNLIPDDEKEQMMIPSSYNELYQEYKDIIDSRSWYDILGHDTSHWVNLKGFKRILNAGMYMDIHQKKIDKVYKKQILVTNKRLPPNPRELYRIDSIHSFMEKN